MTIASDIAVIETAADNDRGSYVDWAAILGGIVFASALSILFLTFGSAVGLSFTNFNARPDVSPIWLAVAAADWFLWVQISSFMAGGYLTGRMRKRHDDATEDEVDVRDGTHGLLVWAGALVVGAVLAFSGVGAAMSALGSAAATLTTAAGGAADALDPNAYFVDSLYRAPAATDAEAPVAAAPAAEAPAATTTETPAATTTTPAATTTTTTTAAAAPAVGDAATAGAASSEDAQAVRDETSRIFARGAMAGGVSDDDRTYLARLVAENTGMSDEEAATRVDQVMTAMDTAATEAAAAAETARKTAVIAAFLVAASLLVSAVGAWWAAQMGGNHRDKNVVFPGAFRRL